MPWTLTLMAMLLAAVLTSLTDWLYFGVLSS